MIDKDNLARRPHLDCPHAKGDEGEDDQDDLTHPRRAQHLRLALPGEPAGLWEQSLLHFYETHSSAPLL